MPELRAMLPDSHGRITQVQTNAPAAGANQDITIPGKRRWRIQSGRIVLTASAVVANRVVYFTWRKGPTDIGAASSQVVQTAGQTRTYDFLSGGPHNSAAAVNNICVGLPTNLLVNGIFSLRFGVIAMDGGDQLSVSQLLVEEWIEDL